MESITQDELKAHLMATDEHFRHLAEEHAAYHRKLDELEAKPHLTEAEEAEEHQIKKIKLHLKDQMNLIMAKYKSEQQQVA